MVSDGVIKKEKLKALCVRTAPVMLLIICCYFALRFGSADFSFSEFFGGLFRKEGFETQSIIIYSVRLPRIFAAVLAGTGLSVSGVLLQSVTGNELAAPNIIGVNAGAGFAMIVLMCLLPTHAFLKPIGAFSGAFVATMIILAIASKTTLSSSAVILAGVAITAFLNAGISFISYFDYNILSAKKTIYIWTNKIRF